MFTILQSPVFKKKLEKLFSISQQREVRYFLRSLGENPFVGKPLSFSFLREKKFAKKRLYFLVYKEEKIILLITVSDKKQQKETIQYIKRLLPEYKKLVKRRINTR